MQLRRLPRIRPPSKHEPGFLGTLACGGGHSRASLTQCCHDRRADALRAAGSPVRIAVIRLPPLPRGVETALKVLEGRWKLVILFHLFDGLAIVAVRRRDG